MGGREKEKMKKRLKLTRDETDRKKGRSWKEGELSRCLKYPIPQTFLAGFHFR